MPALVYEKKGNIGYITINRPEVLNAMNAEVNQGIEESFIQARDDNEVRAIILTGAGDRAFTVGADIGRSSAQTPSRPPFAPFEALPAVPKPIIAAINGYCLGAGFFLASACDVRVAVEKASFGIPEVALGMVPAQGITQWLPQLMPGSIALKLLLTGERFSAADAYRFGYLWEIVSPDKLMSAAEKIAEAITNNAPLAVKGTKLAFWTGLRHGMDEGLKVQNETAKAAHLSEDAAEARKAFVEKRKPVFKGK